ncbi:hypothetical protein CcCBS67573_g08876 [Chytriomyces confervae]|uniref:Peroxisomal biogenesis factor 11 n=1 Tax=Chytriomyces confervae TaxID=246404 RepID=A0A507EFI0_9FUNG|nr:hypothetical protein CcCBS67573_g08876 [Chytriomyces confervae]
MGLYTHSLTAAQLKLSTPDLKPALQSRPFRDRMPSTTVKKEMSITEEILLKVNELNAHEPSLTGEWPMKSNSSNPAANFTGRQSPTRLEKLDPSSTAAKTLSPTTVPTEPTPTPDFKHLLETAAANHPASNSTKISPLFLRFIIFRKLLLLSDGRDKIFKVIQYASKILLWSQFLSNLGKNYPSFETQTRKSLSSLIPHLSILRKLVRTGNAMAPIETLCRGGNASNWFTFLNTINSLFTSLADDGVTLSKVGITQPNPFFITWADRLWLVGIGFDWLNACDKIKTAKRSVTLLTEKKRILGLQSNHVSGAVSGRLLKTTEYLDEDGVHISADTSPHSAQVLINNANTKIKQANQDIWLSQITLAKLVADFIFCSFDVFGVVKTVEKRGGINLSRGAVVTASQLQKFQDVAALVAGILGTWKLYSSNIGK